MPTRAAWQSAAREFYWTHGALQRAYARTTGLRAIINAHRGRPYAALVHYCAAARRLRANDPRNAAERHRRLLLLTAFVHRANHGAMPATPATNPLVAAFLQSRRAEAIRRRLQSWTTAERARLRGNLIILKAPHPRERGALLLTYTGAAEEFLVTFRLPPVFERFTVVLEPSWSTFPEPFWALFAARDCPALCQAITEEAVTAITTSRLPLVPLAWGAQDWVDDQVFRPLGLAKEFDLVMVASFAKWKRHAVLFEAMRRLHPRRLRVALVGTAWERTQDQFEAEMRAFGVREDCTLFRGLDPTGVNEVLNRSRVAVLLSRIEGGNRGLMEALAAGVPVVVYRHIIGPRLSQINPTTGRLADDEELPRALVETIERAEQFQPRRWFEQNSGYRVATARLNAALRQQAEERGEAWTTDIVAKVNRPDAEYVEAADANRLESAWRELESLLVG